MDFSETGCAFFLRQGHISFKTRFLFSYETRDNKFEYFFV